jgi:hypothetical protein
MGGLRTLVTSVTYEEIAFLADTIFDMCGSSQSIRGEMN